MNNKYIEIFQKYGFNFGRMISGSKSGYHERNPENLIIFNARIYAKSDYLNNLVDIKDFFKGQDLEIWYGDLDISKDIYKLYRIYIETNQSLVITGETGNKVLEIGD